MKIGINIPRHHSNPVKQCLINFHQHYFHVFLIFKIQSFLQTFLSIRNSINITMSTACLDLKSLQLFDTPHKAANQHMSNQQHFQTQTHKHTHTNTNTLVSSRSKPTTTCASLIHGGQTSEHHQRQDAHTHLIQNNSSNNCICMMTSTQTQHTTLTYPCKVHTCPIQLSNPIHTLEFPFELKHLICCTTTLQQ